MTPPLALYVHLPWCVHKCPYCDFNSHATRAALPERAYVDALLLDLDQEWPLAAGRPLISVFLGGGTPSLFSPTAIHRLLGGIRSRLDCVGDLEVTLEANPGTVEQERFRGFRDAGVTRLSIGVQSFDDALLQCIGRGHGGQEAWRAVEAARRAGFEDVNLDLMYGLPGQSPAQAQQDIERACALEPTHLSWYQLTLEPGTPFHRRPPAGLPDEDAVEAIERPCRAILARHGLRRYEISAYARPGRRCRHNLNYWRFGDYLGIGAGAHGKVTGRDGVQRYWKTRQPAAYLARAMDTRRVEGRRTVTPEERIGEYALNAFRLVDGVAVAGFEANTGLPRRVLDAPAARAQALGLVRARGGRLRPTARGLRFHNDLVGLFFEHPLRHTASV